ncbi:MAG: DNA mismatch repair protein MutS [bacterium]
MTGSQASRQHPRITPMLTQYLDIKAAHPGALLLFRMGDFYETFFEDAQELAALTGVTLTSRDAKSDHPVPLAGVPYHALDTYLTRLLEAGKTVAICEQVEDPAQAKGLVKREVVEIISPGTATSSEIVASDSGRYCLAWAPGEGEESGWAILDATTGDFRCGQERTSLVSLVQRYPVSEVIVSDSAGEDAVRGWRRAIGDTVLNRVNAAWFHPAFARSTLQEHFQVAGLTAFGLADESRDPAAVAAGAAIRYLTSLAMRRPAQVVTLQYNRTGQGLILDEETLRNLEIFRTFRGERGPGTLVHHCDRTSTPMGRRFLELRLASPLTDLDELAGWHAGVAGALAHPVWRRTLRTALRGLGDLQRQSARAAAGRIGPAALRQLGEGLLTIAGLKDAGAEDVPSDHPVLSWIGQLPPVADLATRILGRLSAEAPANLRKPGYIAAGIDSELDRARSIARDSKGFLAGLQQRERERTGISTLKVGFNKVFGYYFEITNKHLEKVPADYQQKQTLVSSARFHTEELKEAENTILAAEETIGRREAALYQELLGEVAARLEDLQRVSFLVANIDLMLAFAELAEDQDYCRPIIDDSHELHIGGGRHPVIEQLLDGDFIPNDTGLTGDDRRVILLTGPNMGGKSTYLRQIALIALLAQAGGFVPARSARFGVIDRIFTRVGASDNLARGESTFYMEMSETAHILHQMTRRSLVILDEIGRGTSTYDGLSLAWSITEFLCHPAGPRPRAVFATHYHELTELEGDLPGLVNLCMDVKEWEGKIIFMHAVKDGRSDKSYGIHVARLAGLPESVLARAQEILASLTASDSRDLAIRRKPLPHAPEVSGSGRPQAQLSLFRENERDALETLRTMDLDSISPLDAFMWLVKIKRQLDS